MFINLINLKGSGCQTFNYEFVDELDKEFEKREIQVGRNVSFGEGLTIRNGVVIGDCCRIAPYSILGSRVWLKGHNHIGKCSVIDADSILATHTHTPDDARIITGSRLRHILQIQGSRHFVHYSGKGYLSIGCETHTFETWITRGELVGATEHYTEQQLTEYKQYIEFVRDMYLKNPEWETIA